MELIKKGFQWLVYSSQDPAKLSLTLKGAIPFLVILFGFAHVPSEATNFFLNDLFGQLVVLVGKTAEAVSAVVGLYGLARKLWNTGRDFYVRFFV